jgi:Arc/MetJ-type ribon-helix-helix transcriptional regulator
MALQLSPKIQARIAEMVDHGDYPDADAMLEEALELLAEHERLVELKAMIAVGVDQARRGEVVEYNEQFRIDAKREALRRFSEGEVAGPDVRP